MARRGGVARRCFLPGIPRTVTGGRRPPGQDEEVGSVELGRGIRDA